MYVNKSGILLIALCLSYQATSQKIIFYKTFGGMGFEMDTVNLSMRDVLEMMRVNPVAHEEFKLAKARYGAAGVLGFAGAILISVPLVSAVAGGHPEWGLAVAGGVLTLMSIPLNRSFQRHAQNALDEYNKQFESTRIKTNLYFTGTGASLVIRF